MTEREEELMVALKKMHYFVEMTAYRLRDALPGEVPDESTIVRQDRYFSVQVVKDADRLLAKFNAHNVAE